MSEYLYDRINKIKSTFQTFLGYPLNVSYNYEDIITSLKVNMNNIGCPYTESCVGIDTKNIECDVLNFFANLWGINKENIWGYITSSGTEGNMQGIYVGREYLGNPVFYTSKDSHYSIFKIANMLRLDTQIINISETGEMDYKDFEIKLQENLERPVLINANLGTTMRSAFDNTREIYRILRKYNKHNNYYIHADGALMGFVLPFLEKDLFFKNHIHSISISGHKFLGIPFPCGIFIMEKKFLQNFKSNVEYVKTLDCTISGSRNGHSPLFFYHIINKKGMEGFKEDIDRCIELAEYMTENIPNSWRNQNSITIVFPKPDDWIIKKWHLASEGNISHAIIMPHVTKKMIDEFINDIVCIENTSV